MPEDTTELLARAVLKIKKKFIPASITQKQVTGTKQPFESLYSLLEVWDSGRQDEGIQKQTNEIYEFLDGIKGKDTVKDMIVKVLTKIGTAPAGEARIDRVWRYCKLHKRSQGLMNEFNLLQRDINALGGHGALSNRKR